MSDGSENQAWPKGDFRTKHQYNPHLFVESLLKTLLSSHMAIVNKYVI